MTEAERQTVIDALEEGLGCLSLVESDRCVSQNECEKEYALIEGALAIMRRKREPVAHMWQHGETGRVGFIVDGGPEDLAYWERMNKSCKIICPLYKD